MTEAERCLWEPGTTDNIMHCNKTGGDSKEMSDRTKSNLVQGVHVA